MAATAASVVQSNRPAFLGSLLRRRRQFVQGLVDKHRTRHGRSLVTAATGSGALPQLPGLRAVTDAHMAELNSAPRPVLLHCGLSWSPRSCRVAERLSEWSLSDGTSQGVICATADVATAPQLTQDRHIKSVPTVLLLRGGKAEVREDGVDVNGLDRILAAASTYHAVSSADSVPENVLPAQALAVAEELERQGANPETVGLWYSAVLQEQESDINNDVGVLEFRALLGVMRSLLRQFETSPVLDSSKEKLANQVAALLGQLHGQHVESLEGHRQDSDSVNQLVARAELIADAWATGATTKVLEEEVEVLNLYADGHEDKAVHAALKWYQRSAFRNFDGLIDAYTSPERRMPDRRVNLPKHSLFAAPDFACDLDKLPGPAAPRALLRRLFAALGPRHTLVQTALAELEFLLDTKKFVPFFTRRICLPMGGPPVIGRGTGRRNGMSKPYWIFYGPDRAYPNTRPMGSPHGDKND